MLVKSRVLLDEVLLVVRQVVEGMNRIGCTGRNASAAVDAAFRIHIHLSCSFELGLILLGMNAVGGADFDAEGVLDAGISDYIGHDKSISRMK
jgi:hypothetical protein